MKKILIVSAIAALGLNTSALARGLLETKTTTPMAIASSDAGIYVGLAGGGGLANWSNVETITNDDTPKISRVNSFVGRIFLGYDFNKYLAAEAGYSYFFNKTNMSIENPDDNVLYDYFRIRTQSFDLMGKIKAPVANNFSLYAKVGIGYLISNFQRQQAVFDSGELWNYDRRNYRIAYGFGADYSITPNIIANIEWLRFNGKTALDHDQTPKEYQPYADIFMLGLKYKFHV